MQVILNPDAIQQVKNFAMKCSGNKFIESNGTTCNCECADNCVNNLVSQ